MDGYRVEAEINMSWDDWMKAARNSLESAVLKYGNENVKTTIVGMLYQILIKE